MSDRLSALTTMSATQLRDEWARVDPAAMPNQSPELLRQLIGYKIQERAFGGLKAPAKRALRQIGAGEAPPAMPKLKAGTQLRRSWHGRTIIVTVLDDGFTYDDRTFGSLSAVAREVTGTGWSGPRFFGLTSKAVVDG